MRGATPAAGAGSWTGSGVTAASPAAGSPTGSAGSWRVSASMSASSWPAPYQNAWNTAYAHSATALVISSQVVTGQRVAASSSIAPATSGSTVMNVRNVFSAFI